MNSGRGGFSVPTAGRLRFVVCASALVVLAVGAGQPALGSAGPLPQGLELRVSDQGTKGNDLMIGASGDDTLAGGQGDDVLIGDGYSEDSPAAGGGNDKLNGGDGNDIVVGDAYSPVGAEGSGKDDISGGPGSDLLVGDALVGNHFANGSGDATGSGDDEINGLPDTDLVVGDAAVFGNGTARCSGGSDKLNGELNNDGINFAGLGGSVELVVGDCFSTGGDAIGATSDSPIINGGDGEDVLVGDNFAPNGKATGRGNDLNMLGGDGDDKVYGDHHPSADATLGGGKDEPRGGDGNDTLEGGPKNDKCSGGDGRDDFVTKGTEKCEETTGAP
jgi:Ca2+-binding RTX toxin-like protein